MIPPAVQSLPEMRSTVGRADTTAGPGVGTAAAQGCDTASLLLAAHIPFQVWRARQSETQGFLARQNLGKNVVMCLTIANATAIRGHQDNPPPARGFTRTRHHAGYLSPGDLFRPGDDRRWPHTVMTVSHHHGTVVLTDQFGVSYRYSSDAVIPTVVLDSWVIPGVGRGNPGSA